MEYEILLRWIHFLSGITWIGLLYYFNFVQVPAMAEAGADQGGPGPAGISKYVAPRALWWFRWGAVVTWLSGAALLEVMPQYSLLGALSFGAVGWDGPLTTMLATIGMGAWLGTIMLFNVWVLIWPNQKKVLGIVQASDEEKARGKRVAFLASRSNVVMSIALLLFMGAQHGLLF